MPGVSGARSSWSGLHRGRRGRRGGRSRRGRRGGRGGGRSRRSVESASFFLYAIAYRYDYLGDVVPSVASTEKIGRHVQRLGAPKARSTLGPPSERLVASSGRGGRDRRSPGSSTGQLLHPISASPPSGWTFTAASAPSSLLPTSSVVAPSSIAAPLAPAPTRGSSWTPGSTLDSHGSRATSSPSASRRLQLRQVRQDVQHASRPRGT